MGSTIIQSFTLYALLQLTYGVPLIGKYRDARSGELVYVVSIGHRSDKEDLPLEILQFCTGTLITTRHVITAEHCLTDETPEDVEVIIGSADLYIGKKYYVDSWITYQNWKGGRSMSDISHDIAILTLSKSVDTYQVTPVKLLLSIPFTWPGAKVKVAGWGFQEYGVKPTVLKTANVVLLSRDECLLKLRALTNDSYTLLQQDMCSMADPMTLIEQGDSGGPLLDKKNYLIGINTVTFPTFTKFNDSEESLHKMQVNGHVSIYYYRGFIKHVTKDHLMSSV